MEYNGFTEEICRKKGDKKFKVKGSWGIYDVYKHIRKNKWYDIGRPLKEHEFYSIVRQVNDLFAKEIADGNTVVFPSKMGKLELRKFERGVGIVDGKLKITYPVNWSETLKLWYEDAEARRNKTLLRRESKWVYHVRYNKYDATYENKGFYEFTLNRFIKHALKENIVKGKTDTLW